MVLNVLLALGVTFCIKAGSLKMNTALEYRTRVVQEGDRRCKKSTLKGIDRPFGGGVESILIRSILINWRLGYFFYLILKGLRHKISKKPVDAA